MKHLVFNSCAYQQPHAGVMLEEALSLFYLGHEVVYVYCDKYLDFCFSNPEGRSILCTLCKSCHKMMQKELPKGMKVLALKRAENKRKDRIFEYSSISGIKRLQYRNVLIGYAALSTFVSLTRNSSPDFNSTFYNYFNSLLNQICNYTDLIYELLDQENPKSISFITGRMFEQRVFLDIAKSRKILIRSNEIIGGPRVMELADRIIYENCLPHDIPNNTILIEKLWQFPNVSEHDNIQKGKAFFEKRANGIMAGDKVYTNLQRKGKLPDNWDSAKQNIIIFNSSEDEFLSVGPDFDAYSLFETQIEGIRFLVENIHDQSIHIYLRIHPNLKDIQYKFHTDLYKLKYDNLTVIPASASVSTYALIENASKVIVFGSTTGAEAAYWGRAVILLGGAFYYDLDICYTPSNRQKLLDLLLQKELPPKNNILEAIKYGYYLQNRHPLAIPPKYINFNICEHQFLGLKYLASDYMKFWGSIFLFKVYDVIMRRLITKISIPKIKLPYPINK